jgi:hypothetical protein
MWKKKIQSICASLLCTSRSLLSASGSKVQGLNELVDKLRANDRIRAPATQDSDTAVIIFREVIVDH